MFACQMSQSEEGMARIEAMCVLGFSIFYNHGYSLLLFYTVNSICFVIEIEHTVLEVPIDN